MPDTPSNPPQGRRWTVFGAAFLLLALILVVTYTSRGAFFSPLALVVVAAIGLAALLMQVRLKPALSRPRWSLLSINVLGLVFALAAVFADRLGLHPGTLRAAALAAVLCFAIGGMVALKSLRKPGA